MKALNSDQPKLNLKLVASDRAAAWPAGRWAARIAKYKVWIQTMGV